MTLQLIEGFDHASSVALWTAKGWNYTDQASATTESLTTGRINGGAFRITTIASTVTDPAFLRKSLPATLTQFVVGFAFQVSALPASGSTNHIAVVKQGATNAVRIKVTDAGKIQIANSGGTTVTGTTTITTNAWHFVEVKCVVNGASGTVETQVNGVADIASSTLNIGSSAVDALELWVIPEDGGAALNALARFHEWDDIYVLNTASSPNNDFRGDCHVETIYPSGVGAHSDWTPNTGSAHWSLVNEHSSPPYPDDDTTYVSTTTVNNIDSYVYTDLQLTSGLIFGVQTNLWARKDEAATRQLQPLVRQSATDYLSGTNFTLAASYVDGTFIWEVDPNSTSAWTIAGVNSAEFGVKVIT